VRLRAGELNEPIAVAGDHEIEMLAGTLDEVRRRVADTLDEIHALNKDLERKVEERTAAMQELLRRLLGATEEERRRIARELHDKTAQLLTALEMALDGMEGAPVDRARHILAETHREVRDLIHDLRPSLLDDLGLAAAVRAYANEHLKPRGLRVSFEIENDVSVSPEVDITVFRILQEIITNVLRHADAESVSIELFQADGRLTLAVDDDGVGFDASAPGGLGLTGLRERATLIGGTILFDSEPGNGTHVRLEVPVLTPGGPTGRKEATP
jgi:signal transduction histidine kinase